jgi:hypothetical protein
MTGIPVVPGEPVAAADRQLTQFPAAATTTLAPYIPD